GPAATGSGVPSSMPTEPYLTTGCAAGMIPLTAPLLAIRPAKCLTVNQSRRPSCGPTRSSSIADPTASTSLSMPVRRANPQRIYGRAKHRGWVSCSAPSASLDQVPASAAEGALPLALTCAPGVARHDAPESQRQHVLGLVGGKPNESVRPVVRGLVDRLAQWAAN